MIKKLRRRFIWIAMLSVTLVLTVILGVVNIINYVQINESSDVVVTILAENGGAFPDMLHKDDMGDIGGGIGPETEFESRYFVAKIDADGKVSIMRNVSVQTITNDEAEKYVTYLYSVGKTSGMYNDFKYLATESDGVTTYVFLYCGRDLSTFRSFLWVSTLIGAGGLLIVFILIIIFSRIVLRPVEESYLKQKSFITNAGHDIKTPLTVINAEAELIEMEYGDNEYSGEIKTQVAVLTALTDKLVFLSKMEENPRFEMASFNVSAALADVIPPYAQAAESKGFNFSADIAKDVYATGNEELIKRAAALILDNAIKYASPKGDISVTLKKASKNAEITFYNTAENIEKGNHAEFFERFYRADKSRNSAKSGNGIGLSAVKAIADMHKGKITAVSDDGKSIKFVFAF